MKGKIFYIVCAAVTVIAVAASAAVLLRDGGVPDPSVPESAPPSSGAFDVAVSAKMAKQLIEENLPAELGIVVEKVTFTEPCNIRLEGKITKEAARQYLGDGGMAGLALGLMPEEADISVSGDVKVTDGVPRVQLAELAVMNVSLPVKLLPTELTAISLAGLAEGTERIGKLFVVDGVLYICAE